MTKRAISLLICVFMICSLSITGFATTPGGPVFTATASLSNVEADGTFTVTVSVDRPTVSIVQMYLKYDPELVERVTSLDVKEKDSKGSAVFNQSDIVDGYNGYADRVWLMGAMRNNTDSTSDAIFTLGFKVKSGVTSGTAVFTPELDEDCGIYWDDDAECAETNDECGGFNAATVTIGGGSDPDPEPEVFAISATESGNDVVVTVENADLAVGEEIKVYVATYTDGDVLVTCQEQALVDGTMTFTGLANANAKVFVWDNQNVPVANVTIQ